MLLKSKCRKRVIFEEKNSVGEWIKKAREKKGLTQQQLADKSEKSRFVRDIIV